MRLFIQSVFGIFLFCFFLSSNAYALNTKQLVNEDDASSRIVSLAMNPWRSNEFYVGTKKNGVFKTIDDGESWEEVGKDIFRGYNIKQIIYHPNNCREIYVSVVKKGLFKSADHGKTWQAVKIDLPSYGSYLLTINPINTNEFYLIDAYRFVYQSKNAGKTWSKLIVDARDWLILFNLAVDPLNPKHLFIASGDRFIFESLDDGGHWQSYPVNFQSPEIPKKIFFSPQDKKTLYLIGLYSFSKSEDGAKTWKNLLSIKSTDHRVIDSVLVNPSNSQEIYVAVINDGLYKTIDGGQSWEFLSNGPRFPDYRSEIRMAFNPLNSQEIYVTSTEEGLSRSKDGGKSWGRILWPLD